MEGFLLKKGFGTKWNRRWCIIDGEFLNYYEDFDRIKDRPSNSRGIVTLRYAEIEASEVSSRSYCIYVKTNAGREMYFDALNENARGIWLKAFQKASTYYDTQNERQEEISNAFSILELDYPHDPNLTVGQANKIFKKKSLRAHPDKGGDINLFNQLCQAFNVVSEILENEERMKEEKVVEFEAILQKMGPGVGLGIGVREDNLNEKVFVSAISDQISIRGITQESGGVLRIGDVLVAVKDENVRHWPMTRVRERLNDFRVPVGTTIRLAFERRMLESEDAHYEGASSSSSEDEDENEEDQNREDDWLSSSEDEEDYEREEGFHPHGDDDSDIDQEERDAKVRYNRTFKEKEKARKRRKKEEMKKLEGISRNKRQQRLLFEQQKKDQRDRLLLEPFDQEEEEEEDEDSFYSPTSLKSKFKDSLYHGDEDGEKKHEDDGYDDDEFNDSYRSFDDRTGGSSTKKTTEEEEDEKQRENVEDILSSAQKMYSSFNQKKEDRYDDEYSRQDADDTSLPVEDRFRNIEVPPYSYADSEDEMNDFTKPNKASSSRNASLYGVQDDMDPESLQREHDNFENYHDPSMAYDRRSFMDFEKRRQMLELNQQKQKEENESMERMTEREKALFQPYYQEVDVSFDTSNFPPFLNPSRFVSMDKYEELVDKMREMRDQMRNQMVHIAKQQEDITRLVKNRELLLGNDPHSSSSSSSGKGSGKSSSGFATIKSLVSIASSSFTLLEENLMWREDVEMMSEELGVVKGELSISRQNNRKLRELNAQLMEDIWDCEKEVEEIEVEKQDVEAQVVSLKGKIIGLEHQLHHLMNNNEDIRKQRDELLYNQEKWQDDVDLLTQKNTKLREDLADLKHYHNSLEKQNKMQGLSEDQEGGEEGGDGNEQEDRVNWEEKDYFQELFDMKERIRELEAETGFLKIENKDLRSTLKLSQSTQQGTGTTGTDFQSIQTRALSMEQKLSGLGSS